MAPLVPRMHLFEIDDQPWFHPWLRSRVQAALTLAWTTKVPVLQSMSPARMVAELLCSHLGTHSLPSYLFIDFCAGGGGPTPSIERHVNALLGSSSSPSASNGRTTGTTHGAPGAAGHEPVRFVLTDLHPHIENWSRAAAQSPNLTYEPEPVDASAAPPGLLAQHRGKKVFRLFNLAFHHFDDPLAAAILRNTVETSDGFGIFELQDRSLASLLCCLVLGLGVIVLAPLYAWRWRSPMSLVCAWVVPVLPFVLVFDGWVSSLRTRTPDEVEALLRACGAEGASDDWVVRSGTDCFMWPCGFLNWVICTKRTR